MFFFAYIWANFGLSHHCPRGSFNTKMVKIVHTFKVRATRGLAPTSQLTWCSIENKQMNWERND